jgi:hypothetical protein
MTYRLHTAISISTKSLTFAPAHFCQKLEALVIRRDRPRLKKKKSVWLISLATFYSKCFIIEKEIPLFVSYYKVLK